MGNKSITKVAIVAALVAVLKDKALTPELKVKLEAVKADIDAYNEVKDLSADLTKVQSDLSTANTTISSLQGQLTEALKVKDLSAELAQANEDLTQAGTTIEELQAQLTEALDIKAESIEELTVTVNKVKYIVNHGAHPHTAQDIAADPDLAKEILKITGQNVLTKV